MLEVGKTDSCNGCHACYSVCPVSAIKMEPDFEGFLRPVINEELCIECGKCEKVCPILNPLTVSNFTPQAYACYNTNEEIRMQSSSGGVFSLLAEKVIEEGGVVFGAKFAEDFSIIHAWADSLEGIAAFRGSKYVQSTIGSTFKECKQFLDFGRKVLFSGTPCQIGGLKNYLGKNYEHLLCVDLICHGVPSPFVWKKYTEYRESQSVSQIVRTSFRRKDFGWKKFSLSFSFENESEYLQSLNKDMYMQFFLRNLCLRPSCYQCKFKSISRISDITLADFWGIQNLFPESDDDKGMSLVFTHSEYGSKMLSSLSDVVVKEVVAEQVIEYNSSMIQSVKLPRKRDVFFKDCKKIHFSDLASKYAVDSMYVKLKKFIRWNLSKIKHNILGK